MKLEKQQKGGIIFFQTRILAELSEFYTEKIGCSLWLDQGGCKVFQFENMLLGFCEREEEHCMGMISFTFSTREEVDQMHKKLKDVAMAEPVDNSLYRIYHFYAKDPEGRNIEFQYFWDK